MDHVDWDVVLNDARSDSEDPETNDKVAEALGMEPLATIHDTLVAYVRGIAGKSPDRADLSIDRMHRDLLLRDGIDPARFLHASQLGLGFGLWVVRGDDWTGRSTIDDEFAPRVTGVTPIAPGIRYDTTGPATACVTMDRQVTGDLPETVVGCLVGRPLSDLVAHGMATDPEMVEVTDLLTQIVIDLGFSDFVPLQGE